MSDFCVKFSIRYQKTLFSAWDLNYSVLLQQLVPVTRHNVSFTKLGLQGPEGKRQKGLKPCWICGRINNCKTLGLHTRNLIECIVLSQKG